MRTLLQALRPLSEDGHNIPDLPLVRLVAYRGEDLLDTHRFLATLALLLGV